MANSYETTPEYQWAYNCDESNVTAYGRLYTWYAVTDSRNVCPTGWHVPSDTEWTTLTDYLGGEYVAGGKLKETNFTHWFSPNTDTTNETGFTSLPDGSRSSFGAFFLFGYDNHWWSSSGSPAGLATYRGMSNSVSYVYIDGEKRSCGLSVRCLRD